jgi:GT2 family glycosyltransferase
MKIFVLTLTWNGLDKLKNLRTGLFQNLIAITHHDGILKSGFEGAEFLVRDNGSNDGTVDELNRWNLKSDFPIGTTVFQIGHNRDNFATGVNYLFEKANPSDDDVILLLNNDIEFKDRTSLGNMLNLMIKTNAAVVGAKLLYEDGKISHHGVIFSAQKNNMPWHHFEGSENIDFKNRYHQAVTAACCFVRAKNFRAAGMMKPIYSWAFEDIDLNLEISINQKCKIISCGETNIVHATSYSLKKNPVNKLFLANNVNNFKTLWNGKYKIDHELYLRNASYNEVKI